MSHVKPFNVWDTVGATGHSTQSASTRARCAEFATEKSSAKEHAADKVEDGEAERKQPKLRRTKGNKINISSARSAPAHPANQTVPTPRSATENALECAPGTERTCTFAHATGIWQVQFPKQWMAYETETNAYIEQRYQNGMQLAHFRQCKSKKHDRWEDYSIAFDRMEQVNCRSGRLRKVRRVERPLIQHDELPEENDLTGVWMNPSSE